MDLELKGLPRSSTPERGGGGRGEGGAGEGFGEHPASPSPLTLQAEAAWVMPGRGLCSLTQFSLFFSKRRGLVIQLVPTAKGCRGSYGRRVFALWWR